MLMYIKQEFFVSKILKNYQNPTQLHSLGLSHEQYEHAKDL